MENKEVHIDLHIRLVNYKGKMIIDKTLLSILKDIKTESINNGISITYKDITETNRTILLMLGVYVVYDIIQKDYDIIWDNNTPTIDNINKIIRTLR